MSWAVPDRSRNKRSRSPQPWDRPGKARQTDDGKYPGSRDRGARQGNNRSWNAKEQTRLNQLQEDEKMREWVAQEDTFVLMQAKKKSEIRVKEGRARPIDWLTITLRVIDPTRNPLDDEVADSDLDLIDPEGVFEGLSSEQLMNLEKDIDTYLSLETNSDNRDYWKVCFFFSRGLI